ncbi:hypothetical protein CSW23_08200 [Thermus scotoductus]|uniref:HTTM-like domain-containing protein n=1 Tax=Thermus scotoductus TaxID=37636 RepID=A0A430V0K0_THESC|nr:DCC1-like thiol-disulfide oxidoreductase family protein [Thermus scotoductus]RTH99433.1 hypothetical protein CSW31_07900 [Thermus scotoductus]RTI15784.1 hypothetical protein CSW23_08200 [Thermus scotoductus]
MEEDMSSLWSFYKTLESQPFNRIGARLLQIGVGAVILYRTVTELPFAQYLYGPDGPAIGSTITWLGPIGVWVDTVFYSAWGVYLTLALWGLGGLGLILGFRPRLSTLLALIGSLLVELRGNTGDGGDNILRLLLLYMLFFHPRIEQLSATASGTAVFSHNIGVIAVYAQLIILYLVSATTKLQGEVWINGTAAYYVTQLDSYGPPWASVRELFKNPWITTLATYSTIFYQLFFPAMLLAPPTWKISWTVFGILLHLSFAILMGLVTFSAVMISLLLFTLGDKEWALLAQVTKRWIPKLIVFVDSDCPYCSWTGRWIKRMDLLGLFLVTPYRTDMSFRRYNLDLEAVDREMHVVRQLGDKYRIFRGFDAVVAVIKHLPPLWPVLPIAVLLQLSGLGPKLYRWLADHRILVTAGSCQGESCPIKR